MEQKVRKQSTFHQTRMNQAKLGAYYTDQEHCKMIAELLEFPEGEEVCCLEPSIGNAEAVITVTGRKENSKIYIFGVELNRQVAMQVMENPDVEDCIYGDFLTGLIISEKAFSFCFANPPYGDSNEGRLEIRFLRKLISYLTEEAVLVFVLPDYVARTSEFLNVWNQYFQTECCYRFHDEEYQKWKQIVLVGRKTNMENASMELPQQIELLPEHYDGEKIKVKASCNRMVTDFQSIQFDALKGKLFLKKSVLKDVVKTKTSMEPYSNDCLLRPPIMPNAGQMYLMAISGAGQGRVGTEKEKDQHLQRGTVKTVEESEIYTDEEGRLLENVQVFSQIEFHIIENDGTIHEL